MDNQDSVVTHVLMNTSIVDIGRSCDVIWIIFKGLTSVALHSQCLFRIVYRDKILLCSSDMYTVREDKPIKDFHWDCPGDSLFDQRLEGIFHRITSQKVVNVLFSDTHDLCLFLENDVKIQIIRMYAWGKPEENENIRIFDLDDDNSPHYLY